MTLADWAADIRQVVVPGGLSFREVAFFHGTSRTLILTDLVLNLEPGKLPPLMRPLLRIAGATASGSCRIASHVDSTSTSPP